jgi:hypothetical protein
MTSKLAKINLKIQGMKRTIVPDPAQGEFSSRQHAVAIVDI